MTNQSSFDRAYAAVCADPVWQTGFHDPVTALDDVWNRFLDWVAGIDFGALVGYSLRRLLLIAVVALLVRGLCGRWPSLPRWKKRLRPTALNVVAEEAREQVPARSCDPATLVAEADRLASAGRFLDAVSSLFKAGIAAANIRHGQFIGLAATVREIGDRHLPRGLQTAVRTIGQSIERGRFAGGVIDAITYRHCRKASERLTDPGSWDE